ncbi:glucokinase [Gammaproteobacteria bacterium]|nr:glucokinase [Gammaproteobacteria bacterium]
MKNALLIDLGGTNVRHAFFINNALSKISKEKISDKEFIPFITKLLNGAESKIEYLVIAAAGPNNQGFINLTNRNLLINSSELEAALNLKKCLLLNDWEAVAFSLSEMEKKSFLSIKGNVPSNKNTLLIGPGTGLGVTLIIDDQIIPTEFGNVLSATKSMMESFGIERSEKFLSLENILSGPGIEMLYEEKFGKKLSSEKIITLALERNEDALFIVNNFLKTLITIIDDLILSFTCKRVILGGAILNSLKSILTSEKILSYFSSRINPKYSQLIEEVQVDLLLEDEPGIFGCLAFLKTK